MSTAAQDLRDRLARPDRTIWAISDEIAAIGDMLALNGGELTPEIEAMMEQLDGDFDAKVERIALRHRMRALAADNAKLEMKRLKRIYRAEKNEAKGLKRLLNLVLGRHGRDKVHTAKARVSRYMGQARYRWAGDTYDQIPERFRRTTVVHALDTEAVKRAVANGEELPPEIVMDREWVVRVS